MKSAIVMIGLFLCLVNGRHIEDSENEELPETDQLEFINKAEEHKTSARHRRRSRQMHGYDYFPSYPNYFDHRREYSRNQEEYLQQIIKLLDEISSYVKRPSPPPPPPQPIYIPYPVLVPVPQYYNCIPSVPKPSANISTTTPSFIPELPTRWPELDDERQNWGLEENNLNPEEFDESDGARPIRFDPIPPSRPLNKQPPPVEHGSFQEGSASTEAPAVKRPGVCEAAVLTCCNSNESEQRNCFAKYNCMKTYSTVGVCRPEVLQRVLENFRKAYAPVQRT